MAPPTPDFQHRPIRSALVLLPLSFWACSILSEILYVTGWGDADWHDVAFYTMMIGIVGAMLVPWPGLVTPGRQDHAKTRGPDLDA